MQIAASARTYDQPTAALAAYFSIQLAAFLLLSLLFVTFVSRRVKRDGTITNLLAVFIAVSVGMSILLLSGTLTKPVDEVHFGVCLANASVVVGTSSAQAVAALNIVLRIVIRILAGKGRLTAFSESRLLTILLLASPWLTWLAFIIASVIVGLQDRSKVFRAVLYCSIDNTSLLDAATIFTAILTGITIILQITVAVILARHFVTMKSFRRGQSIGAPPQASSSRSFSIGGASLPLIIRLGVFGLCVILALICAVVTQGDFTAFAGDFSIDAIGVAVFFIFGSQADVLRAWHIFPQSSTSSSHPLSNNNNTTTSRSGGITITTETFVMGSLPELDLREGDLESLEEGSSQQGGSTSPGWGSQVALRKEDESGLYPEGLGKKARERKEHDRF